MMAGQSRAVGKSTTPSPVYAVFGQEEFLQRKAVSAIVRLVLGEQGQHMAMSEHEGPAAELADVLDDLRTLPFLAERRLVVVRDADALIGKHRQSLERYVSKPCPTGVLLLVCRSLASNTRLYKAIDKLGGVIRCDPPGLRSVPGWVVKRCRDEYGKRVGLPVAEMLCDLVGSDLGQLDSDLSKLALYVGDKATIEAEDVQALVGSHRQETVFAMLDALANCDADEAVALWQQVLATDRDAPYRAIGGLAWGVRQMLSGRSYGRTHPKRDELHEMLLGLLDADVAAKTGRASVQSAVEQFIVKRCTAN